MRFLKRRKLPMPSKVWGTMGFEFWTFLSLLLLRAGSQRILELGSGRSTIAFAEYASFRGARLVSLETSVEWFNMVQLELRCLNLPVDVVKFIRVGRRTGWYDLEQLRLHVGEALPFDCVLIDAPNDLEGDSRGMRDAPDALRELATLCRGTELVLIDDVHRRHVFDTIGQILDDVASYDTWFYDYRVIPSHLNSMAVSARRGSAAADAIPQIQKILDLKLDTGRSPDRCPEP